MLTKTDRGISVRYSRPLLRQLEELLFKTIPRLIFCVLSLPETGF